MQWNIIHIKYLFTDISRYAHTAVNLCMRAYVRVCVCTPICACPHMCMTRINNLHQKLEKIYSRLGFYTFTLKKRK